MSVTGVFRSQWFFPGTFLLSLSAHLVTMGALGSEVSARRIERKVEMAFYEPPATPKPEVVKPLRVKVPSVHAERPKEAQPVAIAGISKPSTTDTTPYVVPIGNTSLAKAVQVVEPSVAEAPSGSKYAPPGSADTEPVPLGEVKVPYPELAQENGVEGSVLLNVTVDASGVVTAVSVIRGPGYGLNEAAREAMRRFKFKPAMRGGEPVGTSFLYTYTFALE